MKTALVPVIIDRHPAENKSIALVSFRGCNHAPENRKTLDPCAKNLALASEAVRVPQRWERFRLPNLGLERLSSWRLSSKNRPGRPTAYRGIFSSFSNTDIDFRARVRIMASSELMAFPEWFPCFAPSAK